MKNRLLRFLLVLLMVGAISLGLVGVLRLLALPVPDLAQPALKQVRQTTERSVRFSPARSAATADLDGRLDIIADQVYDQPDFITNTIRITATGTGLSAGVVSPAKSLRHLRIKKHC